jgi:hypothetical protein
MIICLSILYDTGGAMANRRITKKRNRMMEKKSNTNLRSVEKPVITSEVKQTEIPAVEVLSMDSPEVEEKRQDSKAGNKEKAGKVKVKNMKARFFVQYQGKEFEEQDILAAIKQKWKEDGNKIKDLQELDLYAKPEEGKVYYTINGEISGSISVF